MSKETIDELKQSSVEMLNEIAGDTELEQKMIKLVYGFIQAGYQEYNAEKRFGMRG